MYESQSPNPQFRPWMRGGCREKNDGNEVRPTRRVFQILFRRKTVSSSRNCPPSLLRVPSTPVNSCQTECKSSNGRVRHCFGRQIHGPHDHRADVDPFSSVRFFFFFSFLGLPCARLSRIVFPRLPFPTNLLKVHRLFNVRSESCTINV
jgi:hypothetical protein